LKKNFIEAKYDFIDEMMAFGKIGGSNGIKPARVLDVGCGIGGTSRYIAKVSSSSCRRRRRKKKKKRRGMAQCSSLSMYQRFLYDTFIPSSPPPPPPPPVITIIMLSFLRVHNRCYDVGGGGW